MDDKMESDSVQALCKCVLGFRRWHQSWARPFESREREASNVSETPGSKPVSKNNQLQLRVVETEVSFETSRCRDCRLGIIEVGTCLKNTRDGCSHTPRATRVIKKE